MRISDKAKIFKSKGQLTDNENIFIEALENRPIIQRDKFLELNNSKSSFKRVDDKHIYKLQFDSSTNLSDAWVDNQTLDLFNSLRDNVFTSSSDLDI